MSGAISHLDHRELVRAHEFSLPYLLWFHYDLIRSRNTEKDLKVHSVSAITIENDGDFVYRASYKRTLNVAFRCTYGPAPVYKVVAVIDSDGLLYGGRFNLGYVRQELFSVEKSGKIYLMPFLTMKTFNINMLDWYNTVRFHGDKEEVEMTGVDEA